MGNLKNLLSLEGQNIPEQFDIIAKELFQNCQIVKGDKVYDFWEIEFYYFNQSHKDVIAYPRTTNAGLWFFHVSGVDITFQSVDGEFYGGILIRGIKERDGEIISGPVRCVDKLFDVFDIEDETFNITVMPKIVDKDNDVFVTIEKTERWIPDGIRKIENRCKKMDLNLEECIGYLKSPYRYIVSKDQ